METATIRIIAEIPVYGPPAETRFIAVARPEFIWNPATPEGIASVATVIAAPWYAATGMGTPLLARSVIPPGRVHPVMPIARRRSAVTIH